MTLLIIIGYILIGILYLGYHHESSNLEYIILFIIAAIIVIALWPIFVVYELGAYLKELSHK
jgi:hypothetical protein